MRRFIVEPDDLNASRTGLVMVRAGDEAAALLADRPGDTALLTGNGVIRSHNGDGLGRRTVAAPLNRSTASLLMIPHGILRGARPSILCCSGARGISGAGLRHVVGTDACSPVCDANIAERCTVSEQPRRRRHIDHLRLAIVAPVCVSATGGMVAAFPRRSSPHPPQQSQ